MWIYEKKLQYPVKVSTCNPMLAKFLVEQYGGADGELAAALRYLNQRYTIPDKVIGLLTDIGTEEFAHLEMIATKRALTISFFSVLVGAAPTAAQTTDPGGTRRLY